MRFHLPFPYLVFVLLSTQSSFALQEPSKLRIASYNLNNYTATDRMIDGGFRKDYPKSEESKAALRRVIIEVAADIIAFQEMGSKPYLEELRRDLAQEGLSYPHSLLVEAEDPDRHLALFSKIPIKRSTAHARVPIRYFDREETMKRGILELTVETSAGELSLWVIHLKSRNTDRKDDPDSNLRRASEATALRDEVLRRHTTPATHMFLLLGDFNDSKNMRPLRACLERGKTPISTRLGAVDSRGESWTLYNSKEDSYLCFDHMLASPGLLRNLAHQPVGRIVDSPEASKASDHRPLCLDLEFKVQTDR